MINAAVTYDYGEDGKYQVFEQKGKYDHCHKIGDETKAVFYVNRDTGKLSSQPPKGDPQDWL